MKQRQLPLMGALLVSAWVVPALAATAHAQGAPATPYRGFNFAYQTEGSRVAAPTQVFDDGKRTYLQFNGLDQVPEIWTEGGRPRSPSRRVPVHLESPYVVIDSVLPGMRLVLDGQDTLLLNQGWRGAQQRAQGAPEVWGDSLPFGPDRLPAARNQAGRASQAQERAVAAASATVVASAVDPVGMDWPVVPAGERMLDAHVEALRRQASDLLQRAEQARQPELAQALRRSIEVLEEAQQHHLLQSRPVPQHPAPPSQPTARQMLALADTRTRLDLVPRDAPPGDGTGTPLPSTEGLAAGTGRPPLAGRVQSAEAAPAGKPETSGSAVPGAVPDGSVGPSGSEHGGGGLVLEVRDNQRLSQALAQFLETQGWRLEWESPSDFVVRRGYTVRGTTLRQILLEALAEYRLSAVLYGGNLVVAVSGATP